VRADSKMKIKGSTFFTRRNLTPTSITIRLDLKEFAALHHFTLVKQYENLRSWINSSARRKRKGDLLLLCNDALKKIGMVIQNDSNITVLLLLILNKK
jgi:hypothetical protein